MIEECIDCEHEFEMLIEEGAEGTCPNCGKRYTVAPVEGREEGLYVLWFTGLNMKDFMDDE